MDSGSAVPTLRPGVSSTLASKILTRARGRVGGWSVPRRVLHIGGVGCGLGESGRFFAGHLGTHGRFLCAAECGEKDGDDDGEDEDDDEEFDEGKTV